MGRIFQLRVRRRQVTNDVKKQGARTALKTVAVVVQKVDKSFQGDSCFNIRPKVGTH